MLRKLFWFLVLLALVAFVWFTWYDWEFILDRGPKLFIEAKANPYNTTALRGQYGDSYGPLNTLFTGLAFVGLAVTIIMQIEESAKRDKQQKEESAKRDKEHTEDNFELNFYKQLDALRSYIVSLSLARTLPNTALFTITGRAVLQRIWVEFFNSFTTEAIALDDLQAYMNRYSKFFHGGEEILAPYFRLLYYVFRYIDRSKITDKQEYADIVRAELSPAELQFLMANCLTDEGEKFKPLVEKYHLLKHVPKELPGITFPAIQNQFNVSAFED